MVTKVRGAEAYVPLERSMKALREAVPDCRGCELYKYATQAVFGEGPVRDVELMMVGRRRATRKIVRARCLWGRRARCSMWRSKTSALCGTRST